MIHGFIFHPEDLVAKSSQAIMRPFRLEECLKIAESQCDGESLTNGNSVLVVDTWQYMLMILPICEMVNYFIASSRPNCRLEMRLLGRTCAKIPLMSQQSLLLGRFLLQNNHIILSSIQITQFLHACLRLETCIRNTQQICHERDYRRQYQNQTYG
jgi:hypothetical protein